MGVAATLVMWPKYAIYTLIPTSYRYFIQNLVLIGQAVSEEKRFEYYGNIHMHVIHPRSQIGSFTFQNREND